MTAYFDDEEVDPNDYDDDDDGYGYRNLIENANNKLAWFTLIKDASKFINIKFKEYQKKTNYTIQIDSEDELFPIAQNWIFSKMPPQRKRNLSATAMNISGNPYTSVDWDEYMDEDEDILVIDPADFRAALQSKSDRGISVFHDGHERVNLDFNNTRVQIWFNRRQPSNTLNGEEVNASVFTKKYISMTLICHTLETQTALLAQLDALLKESKKQKHIPVVRIVDKWNNWSNRSDLPMRTLESVVLKDSQLENLISDLQKFIDDEPKYNRLSVPYHRGYLFYGPPGTGKALALDTPILTTTGWSTIGSLEVGDYIYDDCGQECRVTYKSPVFTDHDCYRVVTDDGASVVADSDHLWPVRIQGYGKYKGVRGGDPLAIVNHGLRNKTTRDLFNRQENRTTNYKRVALPVSSSLNTMNVGLPIDPYILGVWLGDGHTASGRITMAPEDAKWVRNWFEEVGITTTDTSVDMSFETHGLFRLLRLEGLLGHKFIPEIYFSSAPEQRLALLQGLIDTDGYVSPKDGRVEFTSTLKNLAEGVQFLARSLGVKASLIEERATLYGRDYGPKYRVGFYLENAARLPRKAERCRNGIRTTDRYLTFEKVASVPTQCIQVDSPSHCYLAGTGLMVTHNTTVAKALAHHFNYDLWYLPLGDVKSDIDLMALFSRVPSKSVLLLEDIDVFSMAKNRTDANRAATLSGLLNCLDGVSTPHGLVTFMTTNDIHALDAAVKRAGRVDRQEYFGYADKSQINRLWNLYFPESKLRRQFSTTKEYAPSEVIEVLKQNWDDPKVAEQVLREFLA